MSMIVLIGLRIWLACLAASIFILIVVEYSLWAYQGFGIVPLTNRILMLCDVILFSAYTYSLKGKPLVNKFVRAFLLLACTVFILYFCLETIVQEAGGSTPFACNEYALCYLSWIDTFLKTILCFCALFEIALTLKIGPLQPTRPTWGTQANVVIVSPDQPQGDYPGALQQPAMVSHKQSQPYPLDPQYPRHQPTQATPLPGRYMIDVQEQHMGHDWQVLPQRQTHQQQPYASPQPSTAATP
ncbi:unnamed protein product [Mortierella alpina]